MTFQAVPYIFVLPMCDKQMKCCYTVEPVLKGHSGERTPCDEGSVSLNGPPATKGHLSCRDTFSRTLSCPLKTGFCYLPRRRRPGTGDIATLLVRLSVRLSVTFSFRTVTKKRIDVFSRNFAGTCTKSWGCAV